jgi:hypothetical protein
VIARNIHPPFRHEGVGCRITKALPSSRLREGRRAVPRGMILIVVGSPSDVINHVVDHAG